MQKKDEGLDFLIKKVSITINKSPEQIQPFFKILKSNWYQTQQDLKNLTIQDYQKMKIPYRIAQTISDQIKKSSIQTTQNNQKLQKQQPNKPKNTLDENKILALTIILKTKLLAKMYDNRYDTKSVIQILYKIIANIVKDPYEMKFRTLKKSNNLIQQNIIQHEPCIEFIHAIGFQNCGQTLMLNKFQVPQLIFVQDCLNELIISLGGTEQQKIKREPEENMFLNVTKFPTSQKEIKQQFSQQKLAEVKYFDALQKLVEIRNKIMSQPPSNRRIKIYNKRWQTKDIQIQQTSFEQQFQKSDDQVIAGYWKQMVQNNAKSQKFQSKRKLQFQYLIKQKIHKETLIRIKLPNQLIIQAYFGPLEKLKQVFNLMAQILIGDLYLFTAPPKKIMDKKILQKTLIELDAVPMGNFYLSANDTFYIQQKYVPYIQQ